MILEKRSLRTWGLAAGAILTVALTACSSSNNNGANNKATQAAASASAAATAATATRASSPAAGATAAGSPVASRPAGSPAATTAATTAASPAAAGQINPAGVLRFAYGTDGGRNYDPHTAANPFVNTFLFPVYDALIALAPDGTLQPRLALSWSFKNDNKLLELKLRQNVVFQDGAPFNADAVKANLDRAKTDPKSTLKADLTVLDNVTVVDPYTVNLNLNAAAGSLPALLADRAGMMISPTALKNGDLDVKPVGAGAYRVIDDQPGNVIVYEKFDKYWDTSVQKVNRIELSIVLDPATRLRSLRSGEIDATQLNPDQIDEAQKASLKLSTDPYTGAFILYLNTTRSEFGNVKVRQALAMAIDRDGINKALQAGKCTPSAQVFPAGYWANDPGTKGDFYKFDPTAAKKLLADAGLPNGFSFSTVVINVPFYSAQAEAIQGQLAQIGVKMDLQIIEPAQLLAKFAIDKSVDSYFSTTGGFVDPAKTVAQLYLPNSTLNPGGFSDPQIATLAQQGLQGTDQAARATAYQQLSKQTAQLALHIPVCNGVNVTGTTAKVQGLRTDLTGAYDLRSASILR
jgi:ABC-type transport system substrate-binding protein